MAIDENSGREPSLEEEEMAKTVLSYFSEHPNAKDTVEGIFHFWLVRQQVRNKLPVLQKVLVRLTSDGVLRAEHQAGATYYALAEPRA